MLIIGKQCVSDWRYIYTSKIISNLNLTGTAGRFGSGYMFPLYLYPETNGQQTIEQSNERTPNLNLEIVKQIADKLGLTFVPEKNAPTSSSPYKGRWSKTGGVKKEYNQITNLPYLKTFRKELRNNLTPAEAALWKQLKGKQLEGRKFRRQHSVGNYILDFYCPTEQIAIELDGQGHFEATQAEYDRERDLFLEHFGIRVLRFENKVVWDNLDGLLDEVKSYFGKQPLSPSDSGRDRTEPHSPSDSERDRTEPLSPSDSSPFKGEQLEEFAPIDILDYIYAVLHSPTYRSTYKEFLKIDFPRVPYPKNKDSFWQLVKLGGELRQIHLLESPTVEQYITQYPIDGDNVVEKIRFDPNHSPPLQGRVYINDTQYFDKVPQIAWEFYIGGYQPAQKWLKDRKGRKLEFDDILHYQKIIVALSETDRLMKEIDEVEIE